MGAYKDATGAYTFLQTETFSCEFIYTLSSNHALANVLPEGFGFETFASNGGSNGGATDTSFGSFYLDVEIPRIGTDTKVTLKPIPLGLRIPSNSPLVYTLGEAEAADLGIFALLARNLAQQGTWGLLLEGKYSQINDQDMASIKEYIGCEYMGCFRSLESVSEALRHLHRTYALWSQQVKHTTITLGWNRSQGRFYVKEKGSAPAPLSFHDFLLNSTYWAMVC